MGYKVGDLNLSFDSIGSESTINSIDTIISRLNSLSSALAALTAPDLKWVNTFGKDLRTLSKRMQNLDWGSIEKGFSNLEKAISPFLNKINSANASLKALDNVLTKVNSRKLKNLKNLPGAKNGLTDTVRWGTVALLAKRLARSAADIVQSGADYTETLNLWETAMGGNLDVATEFVNKMNEAYGISEKTLMNAQAIFKNMLVSLGEISDTMAYQLSEGITQMALDYASLYNQNFDQAFTKFQAALAGQVRPIRSVAGYDITENTLFQLYESLGGTKSMRQLSRTEKQLLSIYAIFQQMEASGATGDLQKTMASFANQSRVMAESWQRTKTYSGVLLQYMIQESKVMQVINGLLIFVSNVLQAVAEETNAIQHFSDPLGGITESATEATDAVEKLKGKLTDFDKFRALNSSEEDSSLAIDEIVLNALSGYSSFLQNAATGAEDVVKSLNKLTGLFDENGALNIEKWQKWENALIACGIALGILAGAATINSIKKLLAAVFGLGGSFNVLSLALTTGAIYYILQAVSAFKDGEVGAGLLASAMAVTLVGAILLLKRAVLIDGIPYLDLFGKTINANFTLAVSAVFLLINGIATFIQSMDKLKTGAKILIPVISALVGAFTAWATAKYFLEGNWAAGLSVGAIVAGAGLMVGTKLSVKEYAEGGLPDKGTMFVAGEAGAEIVYNAANGQSGVANIQQIAQATRQGTLSALQAWWGGSNARGDIPKLKEASATGIYEAATGVAHSYGKTWAKV